MSLANSTPAAVATQKEAAPSAKILIDSRGQEARRVGRGAHGQPQQDGDDVDEGVAGRLGQPLGDPALLEQVAEEEHAQQGDGAGRDERREQEGR